MVNIAVFAAFSCCDRHHLLTDPAFKPVCRDWQLDVSRYGWQKRQDRGKKWQQSGKVGGKNGKVGSGCRPVHATVRAVALGQGGRDWHGMRLFKVLAARGGAV